MLNATLNWEATDQLDAWFSGEFRSKRFRGSGVAYDELGDFKAYNLFHLGGSYQATETVALNATIYNLFDKDFIDYRAYDNGRAIVYGNTYTNVDEGRRLWLSANIQF